MALLYQKQGRYGGSVGCRPIRRFAVSYRLSRVDKELCSVSLASTESVVADIAFPTAARPSTPLKRDGATRRTRPGLPTRHGCRPPAVPHVVRHKTTEKVKNRKKRSGRLHSRTFAVRRKQPIIKKAAPLTGADAFWYTLRVSEIRRNMKNAATSRFLLLGGLGFALARCGAHSVL